MTLLRSSKRQHKPDLVWPTRKGGRAVASPREQSQAGLVLFTGRVLDGMFFSLSVGA